MKNLIEHTFFKAFSTPFNDNTLRRVDLENSGLLNPNCELDHFLKKGPFLIIF